MIQEAQAAAQAISGDGGHLVTSQLAGAALLAYLLQWIKHSRLVPWVGEHTKGINYALTGLMSLVATIGIHYNFDASTGVLTIGGLHASTILSGLIEWAKQWAFQQGAADMIFTKSIAKEAAPIVHEAVVAAPVLTGTGDGR